MAGSVNQVILVGNCGKDPEIRTLQTGDKMVNLTVATSEHWTDKASGEKKEKTEWHKVVIWNDRIGTVCEKYVKKGMKLYIQGSLQTRKWTAQDGGERYSTEVVIGRFDGKLEMLSKPAEQEERAPSAAPAARSTSRQQPTLDDEIPF